MIQYIGLMLFALTLSLLDYGYYALESKIIKPWSSFKTYIYEANNLLHALTIFIVLLSIVISIILAVIYIYGLIRIQ